VPPKAYDTFVKEWTKVSGRPASALTAETQVLFPHSSVAAHAARVKKVLYDFYHGTLQWEDVQEALGPNVRAIVISSVAKKPWGILEPWGVTRFIVDEAHVVGFKDDYGTCKWVLRLSAAPLSAEWGVWGSMVVTPVQARGLVPDIVLTVATVPPVSPSTLGFDETCAFVSGEHKYDLICKNLANYVKEIRRVLSSLEKGQVVIYLPDGDAGDLIVPEVQKRICLSGDNRWEIFVFKHSVAVINTFVSREKSILFIRLSMSEAINILGSELIVVRPDWVNSQRYSQIIGRLMRLTNHNPTVRTTIVVPTGVPEMRVRFYESLRQLAQDGYVADCHKYRAVEFLKTDATLRALGSSMARAAPTEVLAAMGLALEDRDFAATLFLEWQRNAHKTLSEDAVKALMDVRSEAETQELSDWLDALVEPVSGSVALAELEELAVI